MMRELSAHEVGLWRGDHCLCRNLSFRLEGGTLLQLAGANGSGKTSLMRALAGIGRIDEGEVRWGGEPIQRAESFRRSLAYLGHHNGLKNHLTAEENYIFHQRVAGSSSEIGAKQALAHFGLAGLEHRPVATLSMGQKRRAALARLLAVKAPLWFLDEPLTSLDTDAVAVVGELLQRHLQDGGMAVVATHQALTVGKVAQRQLALRGGA